MNYLLDTCSFIWLINQSPKLSKTLIEKCKNPENNLYLSTASTWEISIKHALKKVDLAEDPLTFIPKQREQHLIDSLPINEEESLYTTRLPSIHRDPFDRLLIAQAIINNFIIITPDPQIHQYPVKFLWI